MHLLPVQVVNIAFLALPGLDNLNTDRWLAPVLQIKSSCELPPGFLIVDDSNNFRVLTEEHENGELFCDVGYSILYIMICIRHGGACRPPQK